MTQAIVKNMSCKLCDLELSKYPIIDGEDVFCCPGCQAVYKVLIIRGNLDNYQENPVFQQALNFGLISNPDLLKHLSSSEEKIPTKERERLHLEIGDMWCPSCAEIIRWILLQEKGVINCVVDYTTDLASVEFSPLKISKERIYSIIRDLGYQPNSLLSDEYRVVSRDLLLRFAVAAFCALNIMMFSYPIYLHYLSDEVTGEARFFSWIALFLSLPVLGYSAQTIFKRFVTSLKVGFLGMETLVVLGVSSAFTLSIYELIWGNGHVYFDSMSALIAFVLLGKMIESKAKFSAKDSLLRLSRALPRRGRRLKADGSYEYIPVKEMKVGDHILVLQGEKLVLDGIVIAGEGSCDESLMTGEVIPVSKKVGDSALAGTLLKTGQLTLSISVSGDESVLKKIIRIVEEDLGHKSTYVRAADSIVKVFVPVMISFAFLTSLCVYFFTQSDVESAVMRFVSILLISCPCAIGIAAPLAESLLMSGMAKLGAIVRNRAVLRHLGKETHWIFDKTGTITEGKFTVLSSLKALTSDERALLKGMASHSTHPIAQAIAQNITGVGKVDHVEEFTGKGMRAWLGDTVMLMGSEKFLKENLVEIPAITEKNFAGLTTQIHLAVGKSYVMCVTLGDRLREGVKSVISGLKPCQTFLLSGDAKAVVKSIGEECQFDGYEGECSPLDKREFIESLKAKKSLVGMLGDGINDAPALTSANVGISVVSATDISIQVSDILLTTDRLEVLVELLNLARKGHRVIQQNLFWAFFYNVIGVALASFGYLTPLYAAVAMIMSSLIVILNALRLK